MDFVQAQLAFILDNILVRMDALNFNTRPCEKSWPGLHSENKARGDRKNCHS